MQKESGVQEVCLNVGSDDGITKEDIIDCLKKSTSITEKQLEKIKVIKRRTFIVVPTELVQEITAQLKGQSLGGRRVRVDVTEYAYQAQRPNRRPQSNGRRFGGGRKRSSSYAEYASFSR